MKKIVTLALTLSALTIASMTLFASDAPQVTTPSMLAPSVTSTTDSVALPADFTCPNNNEDCPVLNGEAAPGACGGGKGNCTPGQGQGRGNGLGNGLGKGQGRGKGCCRG